MHLARLLDFYQVRWKYEPRSFPIDWDEEGRPAKLFTPDFYLPDEDAYIELTTMNQKLVTKKNRKVRRLRELYPDVKIKVLYQRDYLHLAAKYGLNEKAGAPTRTPTRFPGPPRIVRVSDRARPRRARPVGAGSSDSVRSPVKVSASLEGSRCRR